MKIKEGFILREIAGSFIVIPIGERVVEFNCLISLSESGAFLWRKIINQSVDEKKLAECMANEYEVDEATAQADVYEFTSELIRAGLAEA